LLLMLGASWFRRMLERSLSKVSLSLLSLRS